MDWFNTQLDHAMASQWAARLLLAAAIAVLGAWFARLLARALGRLLARFQVDAILTAFLRNLAYGIGLVVVAVAALDALGVPTSSLLALLGAAGLAIGLALKDSLANLASGVMLIVLRPFRSGDHVSIAGIEGIIEQVRLFQTILHSADNREIILPNGQITAAPIINFSKRGNRRIDLDFTLPYDAPLAQLREVVLARARAEASLLPEPPVEMALLTLADNGARVQLRAWTRTSEFGQNRASLIAILFEEMSQRGLQPPLLARQPTTDARPA